MGKCIRTQRTSLIFRVFHFTRRAHSHHRTPHAKRESLVSVTGAPSREIYFMSYWLCKQECCNLPFLEFVKPVLSLAQIFVGVVVLILDRVQHIHEEGNTRACYQTWLHAEPAFHLQIKTNDVASIALQHP
eukprot:GEMP01080189.1.p1 GENE.GEMP01080189.1~~GEMP01080189.1.p1  ORF type:complete len:131 (-),score=6.69 GEMP01080189.1:286-678(-)